MGPYKSAVGRPSHRWCRSWRAWWTSPKRITTGWVGEFFLGCGLFCGWNFLANFLDSWIPTTWMNQGIYDFRGSSRKSFVWRCWSDMSGDSKSMVCWSQVLRVVLIIGDPLLYLYAENQNKLLYTGSCLEGRSSRHQHTLAICSFKGIPRDSHVFYGCLTASGSENLQWQRSPVGTNEDRLGTPDRNGSRVCWGKFGISKLSTVWVFLARWFKPWTFHPLVGGRLTIEKGHLTIPKRSQRIARWLVFKPTVPMSCFCFRDVSQRWKTGPPVDVARLLLSISPYSRHCLPVSKDMEKPMTWGA